MVSRVVFSRLFQAASVAALVWGTGAHDAHAQQPHNWSGFYVGAQVGGTRSQTNGNSWGPGCSTDPSNFRCFGEFPILGDSAGVGAIAGGHLGYNWQIARTTILGVEGDWSWANNKSSFSGTWISTDPVAHPEIVRNGASTTLGTQVDQIATLRARLGFVVTPSTMVYLTGGAAWAQVNNFAVAHNETSSFVSSASVTKFVPGAVYGGGLEVALSSNWALRGEYLRYELKTSGSTFNEIAFAGNPILFRSNYTWGNTTIDSVRAGLSYKF